MMDSRIILKILTFNIGSGRDIDGHIELGDTIELLKNGEADVICLQEVDRFFSARSRFQDQTALLAEGLGMSVVFGPGIDEPAEQRGRPNRQFGNAVLTRLPILSSVNHRLPSSGPGAEPRSLLEVTVDLEGTPVIILNTHLALEKEDQQLAVEDILARIETFDVPYLLAGDFNMTPDDPSMQPVLERLESAFDESLHYPTTYSRDAVSGNLLDYIFMDGNWRVLRAFVMPTLVSDHFPVAARLQLFTKTTQSFT